MANIILNEQAQGQITEVLNQLPISHLAQAQKIMGILNENQEKEKETKK
jgi:hypothetical protein